MITEVRFRTKVCSFEIDDPTDLVQMHLAQGEFFEANWLEDLLEFIGPMSVVIDVGANVGNHTVFFASVAGAAKVISFELYPRAIALLERNVARNCPGRVDLTHVGVGCSDSMGTLALAHEYPNNLGATEFTSRPEHPGRRFPSNTLDDMLGETRVDFVKIDVEGMETKVLSGLSQIALAQRPLIYLEAWARDLRQSVSILQWLLHHGYRVERVHGPNLLCVPISSFKPFPMKFSVVENGPEAYDAIILLSRQDSLAVTAAFFLQGLGYVEDAQKIIRERVVAGDLSRAVVDVLYLVSKAKGEGLESMIKGLRSLHPIARSRILRDDIILDRISKDDRILAYCLACDAAGAESSTACHAKSVMLQAQGLIDDAVEQARAALRLAVFGRANLMIRLADLIRVSGGDLLEAKTLADRAAQVCPNNAHFAVVQAAIDVAYERSA